VNRSILDEMLYNVFAGIRLAITNV